MPLAKDKNLDEKLVSLIDLCSHIVRGLIWQVAKEESLSPIQIHILIYLAGHGESERMASNLALHYGLTLATISDAVSALCHKRLVVRHASKTDGRAYILKLTKKGIHAAERVSGWANELRKGLSLHDTPEKETALMVLMDAMRYLKESGAIQNAKICLTCTNFVRDARIVKTKPHYCNLTGIPLAISDLNIDCKTYAAIEAANIWRGL